MHLRAAPVLYLAIKASSGSKSPDLFGHESENFLCASLDIRRSVKGHNMASEIWRCWRFGIAEVGDDDLMVTRTANGYRECASDMTIA